MHTIVDKIFRLTPLVPMEIVAPVMESLFQDAPPPPALGGSRDPTSPQSERPTLPVQRIGMFRCFRQISEADHSRAVLNGKKKLFRYTVFPKKPAGTPCAQPWLVAAGSWRLAAIGSWQLATGGWWWLVVLGGRWWLVVGGWWRLVVVSGWRLVAAGGWQGLAVVGGGWQRLVGVGGWRFVVPWGGPEGRSLTKGKQSGSLRTALDHRDHDCGGMKLPRV